MCGNTGQQRLARLRLGAERHQLDRRSFSVSPFAQAYLPGTATSLHRIAGQNILEAVLFGQGENIGGGQHCAWVAVRDNRAVSEHNQIVTQGLHFQRVVRHEQHGNLKFRPHPPQKRQEFASQGNVQRGKRLVKQEQARPGAQGTPEGNALPFATGQGMHAAFEERAEFEDVDYGLKRPLDGVAAPHTAFPAGQQIVPDVLVREEQTILGDIPDMALRWLDTHPPVAIQPRLFPQRNHSSRLAPDTTNRFQQAGFTRPGDTENSGHVFFGM